jgi:hypothetical protein
MFGIWVIYHIKWAPWDRDMARPQVADGLEGLQKGQSKRIRNSWTSKVLCTTSSYRLDTVLMIISALRVLQRSRDAIRSLRLDKWQAGTMVSASRYRTEPHFACCAAIPRRGKHSCHHPTTVLSGSLSEWFLDTLHNHWDIKSNATAELRKIPKEAFRWCSRVLLWSLLVKRCRMPYHYSAIPPFRELFDSIRGQPNAADPPDNDGAWR